MKANKEELTQQKADSKSENPRFLWRRFWLVVSALWLQIVVIIFIGIETKYQVRTPIDQLGNKILCLLGL
jgi:hypothetical protein